MLHIAVTTRGQLRIIEGDTTAQEDTERLSEARVIETSPKKETQLDKKADNATAEATLNKDALNHKMTDWEYLMWLNHNSPMAGHLGPKHIL